MSAPTICVPGQRLSRLDESTAGGAGTYTRHGYIYSTLAGSVNKREEEGKTCVEVKNDAKQNVVPCIGAIVTCKISSVNPRFCKCSILAVEGVSLKEPFRGIIRREDVRATEKDKIELYKCFKPRDIVLARVLTLGDSHSYLLTTGENELGVVIATSEAGAPLVPISWCEMQCPRTLAKEPRKVAKVQPQHIADMDT